MPVPRLKEALFRWRLAVPAWNRVHYKERRTGFGAIERISDMQTDQEVPGAIVRDGGPFLLAHFAIVIAGQDHGGIEPGLERGPQSTGESQGQILFQNAVGTGAVIESTVSGSITMTRAVPADESGSGDVAAWPVTVSGGVFSGTKST